MLKRMMEFKGPLPQRMIKNHIRGFETMGGIRPHFTEVGQFMQQEPDPVTGKYWEKVAAWGIYLVSRRSCAVGFNGGEGWCCVQ